MKRLNLVPVVILAVLLAACFAAYYSTRETENVPVQPKKMAAADRKPVDEPLLEAANTIAALAQTSDEQDQAREALHLADDELDLAFATALREAAAYRPPATGPLHDLIARTDQLKVQITADQSRIGELTKQAASNQAAADQLALAKSRLLLDQDELDDAQQDLARQGGDPHAALERALQSHEAMQHKAAEVFKTINPLPTNTLSEQVRAWFSLRDKDQRLLAAEQQATGEAGVLSRRHNDLDSKLNSNRTNAGDSAAGDTAARITSLRSLSDQRKTLTDLDKRIQDCQQLAGVYRSWRAQASARQRGVLHLLLGSVAVILAILLVTWLVDLGLRHAFHLSDRKRLHQMRIMAGVGVQFAAVALILLIIFGPPSQISTIIGFTTAGLTLALRDFIVAFFGWFALMGKNGIRVGDWVEIEGVSGEVIEIGLLKTVLLELGNWTNIGYPTGRQVAFSNSFAVERHYFNFSTTGQWLWDELQVMLPAADDPYKRAQEIRDLVDRETEADALQAAQDWERVTKQYGARSFAAKPTVNLTPSVNGLDVVIRYITRAPQRHAVKSKLFQEIVDLLHKPVRSEAKPA